ncbi:hypothetical protein N1614_04815 [Adlercreutzia muris]|uniref:Uncharacterized protein n=1 Tax=Adlercreutzia muris TaxID=1796610 RepID=A0A7C8BSI1_9ACTN|nr:hypothetical protein [Adlercreutzia muris]KAB1651094.1 hypothetical protein F8D48_02290 [Adlercreutzia muris]MCR2028436.1 hypothetical protein [Adlercreutzia muris]MCU7584668.1 hypothetical protein [Adlercreutzia muris]
MDRMLKVLVGILLFLVIAIALFFVPLHLDGRFRPSGFEMLMARNDAGVVVSRFKELRSSALLELNQSEWGQSYALGGERSVCDLLADTASSRIPAEVWAAVEGAVRFSDPDVRIPISLL